MPSTSFFFFIDCSHIHTDCSHIHTRALPDFLYDEWLHHGATARTDTPRSDLSRCCLVPHQQHHWGAHMEARHIQQQTQQYRAICLCMTVFFESTKTCVLGEKCLPRTFSPLRISGNIWQLVLSTFQQSRFARFTVTPYTAVIQECASLVNKYIVRRRRMP